MKEETKKKLCKISKIVGFVITFGFAVFGVLCAAILIGNGSKKDDIKTLDTSLVQNEVRLERNIKPRKAPDFSGADNLLEGAYNDEGVAFFDDHAEASDSFRVYCLELGKGYYFLNKAYLDFPAFVVGFSNASVSDLESLCDLAREGTLQYPSNLGPLGIIWAGNNPSYFYFSGGSITISTQVWVYPSLYLVDTLEVPPSDVINFPSNWSPMALISDNLSVKGGYAFVDVSPASYESLVPITVTLRQNLFRYDGKVYNEMVFTFVDLSHGDGYIQDDGQPWKPWEKTVADLRTNTHVFGLYSLRFNASFSGESIVALSPVYSDTPFQTGGGTYYPATVFLPTGEYRWVNPKVTYIEVIDSVDIDLSTRYNGRYSDYSDLALLAYINGYLSEGNYLSVGASGGVFDLMTGAFNGLLPILSVQILPNITLGILLFLPLIGGIIVIIIRVIKK